MPWLGLLHKISLADTFCIVDNVQYTTKDFLSRNRIKTKDGPIWLTVPVESKNHYDLKVKDVKIASKTWTKKHFKSICHDYARAPYFGQYIDQIESILLAQDWVYLKDLDRAWLDFALDAFSIHVDVKEASDLNLVGSKSDLVLEMCRDLTAQTYIFGAMGVNYADVGAFQEAGVSVIFQQYNHPIYRQLHGEFIPNMSFIDLLFNHGPDSREILLSNNVSRLDIGDGKGAHPNE